MSWRGYLQLLLISHFTPSSSLHTSFSSRCHAPSEVSSSLSLASSDILLTFVSSAGLLIECDPSIKSMILKYDEERHDYIVEDLDDENHLVIKESQLQNLKVRLDQVPTTP